MTICVLNYYRGSLNRLVSLQFPLTSSELPVGGPLLNEYTNIIEKVKIVELSNNNVVSCNGLDAMINLFL